VPVGHQCGLRFANVRVNDRAQDTHQPDQTTESETTIAVAGSHVAVGYNDSQQTGLFFTAGSDLTGYSYSTDGGASFTDGGTLPDTAEFVNLGDPWLASTRAGDMYYSTLADDALNLNLDVAVAKSADGGRTWATPVPVYRPPISIFYFADKPALATGPDPVVRTRDDLYDTWDEFAFTPAGQFFTGLPVAHSTDGGATWHLVYAKRFNLTNVTGCSSKQFIGATPIVNPAAGTVYVVAERLVVNDPNCVGTPPVRSEWIYRSINGGKTFGPGVKIANAVEAVPNGLLFLGPGKYMRDLEFRRSPCAATRSTSPGMTARSGRATSGSPPPPTTDRPGQCRLSPAGRRTICSRRCQPTAAASTCSTTTATQTTPWMCWSATPARASDLPPSA
jgi:hypothetical protein